MKFYSFDSRLQKANLVHSKKPRGVWVRSFIFAVIIAMITGYLITPIWPQFAALSVFAMVFAIVPAIMFLITRKLVHLGIGVPIFVTWAYFLAPYLYPNFVTHPYRIIPSAYLPEMCLYATLSIIALFVGYYLTFKTDSPSPIASPNMKFSLRILHGIIYVLLVSSILQRLIHYYLPSNLDDTIQSLIPLLDFTPVLAICAGLLYFLRGGRSILTLGLVGMYFILELLLRVSETLFSKIAYLLAALFIIYIIERRRIPWVPIIIAVLIAFPVFNNRFAYRSEAVDRWHFQSEEEKLKLDGLVSLGLNYVTESLDGFNWDNLGQSMIDQAGQRLEGISVFGQTVYFHEILKKPYKYGETFWWLPLTPIPRVIFPWKPVNYHPTLLATEYGLRLATNHNAVNFPMLVEMYINFGFYGMVILSFFQGVLFKWCLRKAAYGEGDLNMLFYVNILWHLEKIESNITLIFGGILQALVMWWLIAKFLLPKIQQRQTIISRNLPQSILIPYKK